MTALQVVGKIALRFSGKDHVLNVDRIADTVLQIITAYQVIGKTALQMVGQKRKNAHIGTFPQSLA